MKKVFLFTLVFLLSSTLVLAWGISFSSNEHTLYQGEFKDVRLNVQNQIGDDKEIVVALSGDTEIAEILDRQERYFLPSSSSKPLFLRVRIPEKAKKEFLVSVKFTATDTTEGIGLATAKTIDLFFHVPDGILTDEEYEKLLNPEERVQETASPVSKEKQQATPDNSSMGIYVPEYKSVWPKIALGVGASLLVILLVLYVIGSVKERRRTKWDDYL